MSENECNFIYIQCDPAQPQQCLTSCHALLFYVFSYLVVNTDNLSTRCTTVGKDTLVTFDTVGIVFLQDISEDEEDDKTIDTTVLPVSSQAVITVMTKQTVKVQLLTSPAIV